MAKEEEQDFIREFSEAVDKMLAGEKAKPHPDMPDDYREAIDFAQKLIKLKGTPRPSFKVQLKDSLLSKLSEVEQKRTRRKLLWERLKHLVPQRPLWRAVAASFTVVIIAAAVILGTGILTPPSTPPPPLAPAPLPFQLEVTPARTAYLPGEDIEIEFKFKNISPEPITLTHFPPVIGITPPKTTHWEEEMLRSFPAGSERFIQPGEIIEYTLIWDQKADNGQQVAPGYYSVDARREAQVLEADGSEHTHGEAGRVAKVLIQYPQGAMKKTIEVNQFQTITDLPFIWKREELSIDLTITLERAELTAEGARFCAFATSPNSPSAGYDHPQWMVPVPAQYTVDGVTKDCGLAGISFRENGIKLTWGYHGNWLDPVPSDARELTFTITKFGDWQGPWEFHMPL